MRGLKNRAIVFISSVVVILSSYLFFVYQSDFRDIFLLQIFLHTATALGFAGLLYGFIETNDESFIKNNSVTNFLSWCGTISYGIYIFHFAVISLVYKQSEFLNSVGISVGLQFLLISVITTVLSYVSYNYFEKRF
ncbi:TPA: acyltransferase family protein [Candidatus Gracilibacteria bacterium]|nr:acyltransferase family protein [Candidatus Gracilibacteria bacterium]